MIILSVLPADRSRRPQVAARPKSAKSKGLKDQRYLEDAASLERVYAEAAQDLETAQVPGPLEHP